MTISVQFLTLQTMFIIFLKIDPLYAMILSTATLCIYTVGGGVKGVIMTDILFIQYAKNKKINEVTSLDESMLETIEDNLPYYRIDEASRIDLEQALQKIRPAYQTVITLFYQQGFTYEEIARIMGISLGTVKTFLYRAKQSLAEELKNYE